jgi:hypothetical protein
MLLVIVTPMSWQDLLLLGAFGLSLAGVVLVVAGLRKSVPGRRPRPTFRISRWVSATRKADAFETRRAFRNYVTGLYLVAVGALLGILYYAAK